MSKEKHPYIDEHFDNSRIYKYLIIGTFPPKLGCKERTDLFRYFYGNEGSLWQILNETGLYPDFNFSSVENIKSWQNTYSFGVTDVLKQCSRKIGHECSHSDSNLVVDLNTDLNIDLKEYILKNTASIDKIYFTSGGKSKGCNSAYWFFSLLMGTDLAKVQNKIIKLPSPSGEFLRSKLLFPGTDNNFGLSNDFYNFLIEKYPEAIEVANSSFEKKKLLPKKRTNSKGKVVSVTVQRFPNCPNYPSFYRLDLYKKLLQHP